MIRIPFSGNPLDRAAGRRIAASWQDERDRAPDTLFWPFWKLQPFLLGEANAGANTLAAGYLTAEQCDRFAAKDMLCVFLGLQKDKAVFALDLAHDTNFAQPGRWEALGHFQEARAAAQLLPLEDAAIMGQAKALLDWHKRHGFCPNCGARTVLADAGYRRHCDACGADHFPRTDPVVIMLAIHEDACLVGRAPRFPKGMVSALAGFVEPGETIEEAVAREVFEEAGVRVRDVRYFASQPWPFPSSLMIGCFADADDRNIVLDETELAEAFWLPKSRLRALFAGERDPDLRIPPPLAIAHHLLKRFAEMP